MTKPKSPRARLWEAIRMWAIAPSNGTVADVDKAIDAVRRSVTATRTTERTREVYDPATPVERIEEIEEAAYARADLLLPANLNWDHDRDRERRAWNELARVCARQKAQRAQKGAQP